MTDKLFEIFIFELFLRYYFDSLAVSYLRQHVMQCSKTLVSLKDLKKLHK